MTIFKKDGKNYNVWYELITESGFRLTGKVTNWGGTGHYILIPKNILFSNKHKGYTLKYVMKLIARKVQY